MCPQRVVTDWIYSLLRGLVYRKCVWVSIHCPMVTESPGFDLALAQPFSDQISFQFTGALLSGKDCISSSIPLPCHQSWGACWTPHLCFLHTSEGSPQVVQFDEQRWDFQVVECMSVSADTCSVYTGSFQMTVVVSGPCFLLVKQIPHVYHKEEEGEIKTII